MGRKDAGQRNRKSLNRDRRSLAVSVTAVAFLALMMTGCGGSAPPPPPTPDFTLSISPSSVETDVGTTASPITISVAAQAGFIGLVNITLQGIPQGITVSPSASFSLAAGASQPITFSIPDTASVGGTPITVLATSGSRSHSKQLTLTADALVDIYQTGSRYYLESKTANDVSQIGIESAWGGSIVEVSLNGTNYVNAHDTGREVQPAFREGINMHWNPTLGGDDWNQGTPTIVFPTVPGTSLYSSAQSLQWEPDFFGGGLGHPILSDILVEQTITAVPSLPHTFKVHYKVTHLGTDLHTETGSQEFPAVYTNKAYSRFIYYAGSKPWTNSAITETQFPDLPASSPPLYAPERWGALVDSQNMGLTVYVPSQYPRFIGFASPDVGGGGPTDNYTNYFAILGELTILPNLVMQGDMYLIAGDYATARQIIYQLHQSLPTPPDMFGPITDMDQPSGGSSIAGDFDVNGWVLYDVQVSKVEILVDGVVDGIANYGSPRPDVAAVYPYAPVNTGYSYTLDTTKYPDGLHKLNIRATDSSGNVSIMPDVVINIAN